MKERFSKLLLGEDNSGGGKGVCSALALSNAITNLAGNILWIILFYIIYILTVTHFLINHVVGSFRVWRATAFGANACR